MEEINDIIIDKILEIRNGNLDSFDAIYDLTKKPVYFTILGILKSKELSEDVMQETYMEFLENINNINFKKSIVAYVVMIGRNKAINVYNKRKRETLFDVAENEYLFSEDGEEFEDNSLIRQAKKILEKSEFEVLNHHVLMELTFKETSEIIKKPIGTVIWLYNKAIKKLQNELKEEYENE